MAVQEHPNLPQNREPDRRRRQAGRVVGVILAGLIFYAAVQVGIFFRNFHLPDVVPARGPQLDVHVIDVSDGSCILLTTPSGRNILIDAGSRLHPGTEIASILGKKPLDMVILTTTRARCIGGFSQILDTVRVNGPILLPTSASTFAKTGRAAANVIVALHDHGLIATPYDQYLLNHPQPIAGDDSIQIAGLPVGSVERSVLSLAVRVEYGSSSLLYAAGLNARDVSELLSRDGNLSCDVLALPDGGKPNTAPPELMALAAPQVVTTSCDKSDPPDDTTAQWISASGAKLGNSGFLGTYDLQMDASPSEPIRWITGHAALHAKPLTDQGPGKFVAPR